MKRIYKMKGVLNKCDQIQLTISFRKILSFAWVIKTFLYFIYSKLPTFPKSQYLNIFIPLYEISND